MLNYSFWDSEVVYSNSFYSASNAQKTVFLVPEGHSFNVHPCWGNTAEHGTAALPQHTAGGENVDLIVWFESCKTK